MSAVRYRIPPEIRVELSSRQDGFIPKITQILGKTAAEAEAGGDPSVWLQNLQGYLARGEGMVVHARMGRTLVGFLVLDSEGGAAPFSWVDHRFRNRGLGERFYSFACINLARPTPEFKFPKEMISEYGDVLKAAGVQATLRDSFYVVHDNTPSGDTAKDGVQSAPSTSAASHLSKGEERSGPRGLVINDGEWVGFSHHDARRLKLRMGRFPRFVEPGVR